MAQLKNWDHCKIFCFSGLIIYRYVFEEQFSFIPWINNIAPKFHIKYCYLEHLIAENYTWSKNNKKKDAVLDNA